MKTPTDPTTNARALIDSAAALAGMTTETPPPLYKDDPERPPLPCYVTDPTTGRRLHMRRVTYPASAAGRIAISQEWPRDAKGCSHAPRTRPAAATVAPTTEPAALARRLRRYLEETQEAHDEAATRAAQHDDHATRTAATIAALVAAGWKPPHKHSEHPSLPTLPGDAYGYREQVSGDRVTLELRGLTTEQAIAITAILTGAPDPCRDALRRLLDRAAAQLDQSATHDGLTNADAIAAARAALRP